jgi:FMN phosphatase YigB (HAD superfamily)
MVDDRMRLEAILWDFGDTLADERWMLASLEGRPDWPNLYRERCGAGDLGSRWNRGDATADDVAAELAAAMGVPASIVIEHMRGCSRQVRLFPSVMAFVRACPAPQAIVTVNCDIFSQVVAPDLDLATWFDPIVTSWEEGLEDKADLCEIAMKRLGAKERAACHLIDNRPENVAAWRARGGSAFHFIGEQSFVDDLAPRLNALLTEG